MTEAWRLVPPGPVMEATARGASRGWRRFTVSIGVWIAAVGLCPCHWDRDPHAGVDEHDHAPGMLRDDPACLRAAFAACELPTEIRSRQSIILS
jgi:hypothetical protein